MTSPPPPDRPAADLREWQIALYGEQPYAFSADYDLTRRLGGFAGDEILVVVPRSRLEAVERERDEAVAETDALHAQLSTCAYERDRMREELAALRKDAEAWQNLRKALRRSGRPQCGYCGGTGLRWNDCAHVFDNGTRCRGHAVPPETLCGHHRGTASHTRRPALCSQCGNPADSCSLPECPRAAASPSAGETP